MNRSRAIAHLAILALLPAVLSAQSRRYTLADAWERFAAQLIAACPSPATTDLDDLLVAERDDSYSVSKQTGDADRWFKLACTRSRLFASEGIAREGLKMPAGYSWAEGAVEALLEGLKRRQDSAATELLGVLAQDTYSDRMRRNIASALGSAADAGVGGRFALRGCSALRWRSGDRAGSLRCTRRALALGVDSSWQLLHLARERFADADTVGGRREFLLAVNAIHDDEDRRAVDWHLGWFLEPDELVEWESLDSARVAWVRNMFADRDLRDGRPDGARIAAHFVRLANIDTMFRVRRSLRELKRFELTATPESRIGSGWVVKWARQDPAGVPASPFRIFRRTHPEFDDRAEVWMRWGPPDERRIVTASAHVEDRVARENRRNNPCQDKEEEMVASGYDRCLPAGDHTNIREGWLYRRGDHSILVSFEGEDFDKSAEATRLVAGVLGYYMCGLEQSRCNMTERSTTEGMPPLSPETLASLVASDRSIISFATSNDGNEPPREQPLTVVAMASRVWSGSVDAPVLLVPYAVATRDLAKVVPTGDTVTVHLAVRQWHPGSGAFQDVLRRQSIKLPADPVRSQYVTGVLELPSDVATASWSLDVSAGEGSGHVWGRGMPSMAGSLAMSDLVVGQEGQGQTWTSPRGTTVNLGPLGAFTRQRSLSVFWQVNSDVQREVQVQISLIRTDVRSGRGLQVASRVRLTTGLNEFQRELDLSQFDAGQYELRITLGEAGTGVVPQRSVPVLLW